MFRKVPYVNPQLDTRDYNDQFRQCIIPFWNTVLLNTILYILQTVETESQFSGKHGYGQQVKDLANKLMTQKDVPNFKCLCSDMTNDILTIFDINLVSGSPVQDTVWREFHSLRTSDGVNIRWNGYLDLVQLDSLQIVSSLLHQFLFLVHHFFIIVLLRHHYYTLLISLHFPLFASSSSSFFFCFSFFCLVVCCEFRFGSADV